MASPSHPDVPARSVQRTGGGMTLRVYRVRPDGTTTTIRERREVEPANDIPLSPMFPPCSCPRCGTPADDEREAAG
ncbi:MULTISPECIES: hypothetical protein [Streptomyces]|uniref:Uncharacterized protein n=1 Tax=Streptomyces sudanensis TaxID=436397 RepID=A0ABY4TD29_9ACTN|nr:MULTISPECIES: hypothetical protein [Streptomyces]MCP9958979.1 hypothetical protein [Streptomyces sudanensis]MCP9988048.1 hypothetical protein [Streptomyces sudanensis]MCQ0000547.1 hypothetical protein [Streptomyces sudanensis]URN16130.1 hypothetical protein MW084_09425 [Streptomyces sudanensis]